MLKIQESANHRKVYIFILIIFSILTLTGSVIFLSGIFNSKMASSRVFLNSIGISTKSVLAKDIYSLFKCPCRGEPIAECTCKMAKERKAYIDEMVKTGTDKDKIILAFIKKYGIDSFIDKNKREKFKKYLIAAAPDSRPIVSLTPDAYSFGDISQKRGVAETSFLVKNKGKKNLIINKLETSCGCTSASIIYQGKESPKFGMDMGQKIPKWQIIIPAGKTAELKVYYDPNFHKTFRGTAIREIYIYSNDPINFKAKVEIELNQVN